MLKKLPVSLTPELYQMLYNMGHGDELVIADANFPGDSCARRLYTAPDMDSSQMLDLVLRYFPVDTFTQDPVACMATVPGDSYKPQTWGDYADILERRACRPVEIRMIPRQEFYERTRNACGVILTGERRRYGNIIIRKGVVEPDE